MCRNTIELCLKRLFYIKVEKGVSKKDFFTKRNSHKIKKELWKLVKPVIENYSNVGEDDRTLEIVEKDLFQIDEIDKQGDAFRYPTTYGLEYKHKELIIDIKNVYSFIRGLIYFLDSCDGMLSHISENEC